MRLLAIGAGVLVAALVVFLGRSPEPTRGPRLDLAIPGAPHAVDPAVALERAERTAGTHDHLVSIEADNVHSNGRVDLEAEPNRGRITYVFGTQPGPAAPIADLPKLETVVISASGVERQAVGIGMNSRAVRKPRCPTELVWKAAIAAGASPAAVAKLRYAAPSSRPDKRPAVAVWTIRIDASKMELEIDDDTCMLR
jgi:hypothetical protein